MLDGTFGPIRIQQVEISRTRDGTQPMPSSRYDEAEDILTAYEQAWQQNTPPNLDTTLAALTFHSTDLVADLVKLDLEYRLRAHQPTLIETYLARYPELSSAQEMLLDLVSHEYYVRQHLGLSAKQSDYQSRFPHLGVELLARLESLRVGPPEIPQYELQEVVGSGGMGVIYRAIDTELQRSVAIKLVLNTHVHHQDATQRFVEEARITGRLQHPGIPPVHRLGQWANGQPYLVMKLIEGRTLAALLAERPQPAGDLPRYLPIFELICQTVAYAHRHGIVHRDLKPANIMIGAFGEVQVMDWGLAKAIGSQCPDPTLPTSPNSRTTQAGTILGTPAYMAPEQAQGNQEQVNTQADVFSLGAILCELLTGQPPYTSANAVHDAREANLAQVFQRLNQSGADPELVLLAQRCLSANTEQRLPNAMALAETITRYRQQVEERLASVEREQVIAQTRIAEEARRRRLLTMSAGLVAGLLVAGMIGTSAGFYRAGRQLERAETAERDNRSQLASSFVDNARLHAQQGEWRAALTSYDRAHEQGHPHTAELAFERFNALHVLNEITRLEQEIGQFLERTDLTPEAHAQATLWQGDVLLAYHASHAAVLAKVDEALAAPLPADAFAYARGLRANSSEKAIVALRQALAENPLHHRAQFHLTMLLLLLGRKEELRTTLQEAEARFGEDTRWSAFRAVLSALEGKPLASERAIAQWNQAWPNPLHQNILRTTVNLCYHSQSVERLLSLDHPQQPSVAQKMAPRFNAWIAAIGQQLAANAPPFPLVFPPVLRLSYGVLAKQLPFDVVNDSIAFATLKPAEQSKMVEERLEQLGATLTVEALSSVVTAHPEGCLRYVLGTFLVMQRRQAEAERVLFLVDDRTSLFPIQRMAHLVALEVAFEQWATTKRNDPQEARRVRDLTKRYKPEFQLGEDSAFTRVHFEGLASKAWQCGEPNLARDLVTMWLEEVPNDPRAYRMLAAIHYTQQDYFATYAYATQSLRLNPDDVGIRHDLQTMLTYSPRFIRVQGLLLGILEKHTLLELSKLFWLHPRVSAP